MASTIMRNRSETVLGEKQHLSVPCIGIQRPSMRKRDDRTFAPVFVIDCRAIFHRNRAHLNFSFKLGGSKYPRLWFYLAGTSTGAPLSFTKNTTNFAGLVWLAFRPTTWTSFGPS